MEPLIRRGMPTDASALKDLDSMVPLDPTRAGSVDRWLRDDHILVAEVDGRAVGYGVFDHGFFEQSNVAMLMVHKEYRGRRIGEHLLRMLERVSATRRGSSSRRISRITGCSGYSLGWDIARAGTSMNSTRAIRSLCS